ncbi:minor capsid protein [Pseudolactococcus reticulitermitis]|uniref:Phage head morphogenesis domain-containing protein n=1 Tax=Pseudolactococcus reticulitermitis TaxID=2025039 RepID=A0A224X1L2_9LACT|nr:minor capsid protein [Lactococcus reticulitermitis]GAX46776.1 hypothetical protein RsY01_355 [Lactococcus reticulitermitis]
MKKKVKIDDLGYWERRAVLEEATVQKSATHTSKVVNAAYNGAQQSLYDEYIKLLKRMRQRTGWDNDKISEFLQQRANPDEIAELAKMRDRTTNKLVKSKIQARLNAEALKHRINRLDIIKTKAFIMAQETAPVHRSALEELLTGTVKEAYLSGQGEVIAAQNADGASRNLNELTKSSQALGKTKSEAYQKEVESVKNRLKELPQKEVKQAIEKNWLGSNYSKRIWGNTDRLAERLEKLFTMKELSSMSERDMRKVIEYEFQVSRGIAERLIRTEANHQYNYGKLLGWRENFSDGQYKLVAILDSRTSQICRDHNGKKYDVKTAEVGENFPPLHPWCRSTVVLVFDEIATPVASISLPEPQQSLPTPMPRPKPYESVKDEWLVNKKEGAEVVESMSRTIDEKIYTVDGSDVTFSHDEFEHKVAHVLVDNFGGRVELLPEIHNPKYTKNPDYLFNGELFELKTPKPKNNGGSVENFKQVIKRALKQTPKVIINIEKYEIDVEEILNSMGRIFNSPDIKDLDTLIIVNDKTIIDIFKRK